MKPLKLVIGLAISLLFLWLALRGIDLRAVRTSLSEIQYGWLVPIMLLHLSIFWIRSIRWGLLVRHLKPLSPATLFPPLAISYLANNTLPLRAGELVRVYLLGRDEGLSKTSLLSGLVLERICDGLALLFFLAIVAVLAVLPLWAQRIGLLAGLVFLGATAFLLGLVFFREPTLSVVRGAEKWLPTPVAQFIERLLTRFIAGLDVLQSPRQLALIFGWSVLVWSAEAAVLGLVAIACGLNLPVLGAFFALVVINLGTMVPASPGYVGTFEFFCLRSLTAFGVAAASAVSFALVLHLVQFLPITLVGLGCLLTQKDSLRTLTTQSEAAA